jgi:hypothetical protein
MNINLENEPRHGTVRSYNKRNCRCTSCKAAWSNYMREYRANSNAVPSGYEVDVPSIAKATSERVLAERAAAERAANDKTRDTSQGGPQANAQANSQTQPDINSDQFKEMIASMDKAEYAQYRKGFAFSGAGRSDIV